MRLHAMAPLAVLIAATTAGGVRGQTLVNWQGGATNNNWTTTSNWSTGTLPTGAFDEVANIANGGTAVINSNLATIPFPDGPPGGLVVTNNSKLDVTGSGTFVTDVSGPSVNGAAAFTNGGVLALTGGATSFSSQGLSFAGGGVYAPVITGASHGLVSVGGPLTLGGGTLKPSFGFTPGVQGWVLADAISIDGAFALDASAAGLPFGRKMLTSVTSGGINGQQLRLDLKNVLAVTVNADTGAASLSSPTSAALTMTGYGLSSESGQLQPTGWNTVTSQLGGGWGVAGTPSSNHLDELGGPVPPGNTTQASLTLSTTTRAIGSPFNANLPFGTAPDVKFQYVTSAGEIVEGDVQFTGLNAVNNLLLTVDPASGQARLTNSSKTTIRLRGYSILSDAGSLKPANGSWNSLDDQGRPGVDEANASATNLSELVPAVADSITMTSGQSFLLGSLFNTTSPRDLELEFLYTSPLAGDFNGDGAVNATDLGLWRTGFGTTYTGADLLAWQRNVGKTSSSAAPTIAAGVVKYGSIAAAPSATAIPEPAALPLAATLAAFVAAAPRHRRRTRPIHSTR